MSALSWIFPLCGWLLAPLMVGVINRVKAIMAGRRGPSLFQLYRDLFKLLRKGSVYSETSTLILRLAPAVILVCVVLATLILLGNALRVLGRIEEARQNWLIALDVATALGDAAGGGTARRRRDRA